MVELLGQIISIIQGLLINPLVYLFPVKYAEVRPGEAAIRYTLGQPSDMLEPGLQWATVGQILVKRYVQGVPVNTESMSVTTSDGISITVNAAIIYEINELAAFLACSSEPEELVAEYAQAAVFEAITSVPYQNLTSIEAIHSTIKDDLQDALERAEAGVLVKSARLQNLEHNCPVTRAKLSAKGFEISDQGVWTVGLVDQN